MNTSRDLGELIENNPFPDFIHFVMAGAVVSGQYISQTPETIHLQHATTYTGLSVVEIELLQVPIDKIIAWGEGEISVADTLADSE